MPLKQRKTQKMISKVKEKNETMIQAKRKVIKIFNAIKDTPSLPLGS